MLNTPGDGVDKNGRFFKILIIQLNSWISEFGFYRRENDMVIYVVFLLTYKETHVNI